MRTENQIEMYFIEKLKDSNIFILVSDDETLGISYIEALASNNIVIAKKNDGVDGLIKNNINGFLVEPTPLSVKKCLEEIFAKNGDEINQIQQNAKETIKNFTDSNLAENYIMQIMD